MKMKMKEKNGYGLQVAGYRVTYQTKRAGIQG